MCPIRACDDREFETILEIINAAAEVYRGAIPAEHWHEPYMTSSQLERDMASGLSFYGYVEADGALKGVMGVQARGPYDLIRHAYVRPEFQGQGIGAALLKNLRSRSERPTLIGTWKAATWAIRFYEGQGFSLLPTRIAGQLLHSHWDVPENQMAVSVVLADSRKLYVE